MIVKFIIDCMGGDYGLFVIVFVVVKFVCVYFDVYLMFVGIESVICVQLKKLKVFDDFVLIIVFVIEVVVMDDFVEVVLCKKKDFLMCVVFNYVKDGVVQVCIFVGNIGVLMVVFCYVFKMLFGIEWFVIVFVLLNLIGYMMMLDFGVNVDCELQYLLQFVEMGYVFVVVFEGKECLMIGLLNIGEEVIKGNEMIKCVGELLCVSMFNFCGNVEGNDIYKGIVDVIVCDGFVGNVVLKMFEGFVQMLLDIICEEFGCLLMLKLMVLFVLFVLMCFKKCVDYCQYNGVVLLGLKSFVIKSYGLVDVYVFEWVIKCGYDVVKNGVLECFVCVMVDNLVLFGDGEYDVGGVGYVSLVVGYYVEFFVV